MPVLLPALSDPADLVIQGELMRLAAIVEPASRQWPILNAGGRFPPMHPDFTPYGSRLQSVLDGSSIRANSGVATPCGAWVPLGLGVSGFVTSDFVQGTELFQLTGVTRDNVGNTLGGCAVTAFETGRMTVAGAPIVGQTVSDGSGNYTIQTANNNNHEVIAYLQGSPDRAAISLRALTPVQYG